MEFSDLISDHVTDDASAGLLAQFFCQALLQFLTEDLQVVVVGVVGVDLGDGQLVVVDVDLIAEKFLVAAFKCGRENGELGHVVNLKA